MKIFKKHHLLRVSPWVLAAACGLLSLIISVFAVNNYQRDKELMTDSLLEKGATLIRFVASSSRNSIFSGLRAGQPLESLWPENVQRLLEYSSGHPGVRSLTIVDEGGLVIANSTPDAIGKKLPDDTLTFIANLEDASLNSRAFNYRIVTYKKSSIFQVAAMLPPVGKRLFEQFASQNQTSATVPNIGRGMMSRHGFHNGLMPSWKSDLEQLSKKRFVILIELDMSQFNRRLQRQKLEIIVLSIVLLLVGLGGWLSIMALEGLKGSQSRLRRVEAFRDILISSMPVGLIATDRHGKIILYNKSSQEFTGITEEKAMNADTGIFDNIPEITTAFKGVGEEIQPPYIKDVQVTSDKGVNYTLQLNRISIVDRENSYAGTLLLMQDLSQVKKLEEELRRNERLAALGKMAAGVAHELRNPLSSIKGLALVLKSHCNNSNEDLEAATILVQEVERLNRSISELLDYARPQQLQKVSVDLRQLLNKAMSLIRIDAETAGVEIKAVFQVNMPKIMADEDKLTQVFLNLLINGIQAMEDGGTLLVRGGATDRVVEVVVEDTGCGISKKDIRHVFDPYFTTKPDGTGLGMAMSAKIVEEHGGAIHIKSREGWGTTVIVVIPR